jgi:hypothetical protein
MKEDDDHDGVDQRASRSNSTSSSDRVRRDVLEDEELLPGF